MNTKLRLDIWAQTVWQTGDEKKELSNKINSAICNKKVNTMYGRPWRLNFFLFALVRVVIAARMSAKLCFNLDVNRSRWSKKLSHWRWRPINFVLNVEIKIAFSSGIVLGIMVADGALEA